MCHNVFDFLKHRSNYIYISNEFKKYDKINAIRIRDENAFSDKLLEHIKNKKYFLFGWDSCQIITEYYNKCLSNLSEADKLDCILITSETEFKVENASEQFKNKFVFYSPSITFGVDFSILTSQNVFIYIKGNTIQPSGVFQQTTRCRNIENVYYYGEPATHKPKYKSLEHVKNIYRTAIKQSNLLDLVSSYIDENDEEKLVENSFFNRFCYNEYVMDTYNTNIIKHYELILVENGFNISSILEPKKLEADIKKEMKDLKDAGNDDFFNDYINNITNVKICHEKYNKVVKILQLPRNKEVLTKYKDIITDPYKLSEHYHIIRSFMKKTIF